MSPSSLEIARQSFFQAMAWKPDMKTGVPEAILFCVFFACLSLLLSELTSNYSQTDKLWSITPALYVACCVGCNPDDHRLWLMLILAVAWATRLTFNFARKGGYQWPPWEGEEDYRWPVLRQHPLLKNKLFWFAFNVLFIAFYQHILLLLITAPTVAAVAATGTALNIWDLLAFSLFVACLILETIADEQQWQFQTEKYRRIKNNEELGPVYGIGFCTTGLFRYSRHPNFFSEQAIWWCFYIFSIAAGEKYINWTGLGTLLLTLLFQGSTVFTESITIKKYPMYKEYQEQVSMLIPLPSSLRLLKKTSSMFSW